MTPDKNVSGTRGCGAELITATKLSEQGCVVSFPLRSCAYDLVVDVEGTLLRVQVKQAMKQRKRVRRGRRGDRAGWLVRLERKRRRGSELNRLRREEFDVLAVVCTPERIYMIPVEKLLVEESSEGLLRGAVIIKTDEDGSPTRADSLGAIERWIPYLNDFSMKSVTA